MIKIISRLSSFTSNSNYEIVTTSMNNRDYSSTVSLITTNGIKRVESRNNGKLNINEANKVHDDLVQEFVDK